MATAETITISPPNIQHLTLKLKGITPYMQNKFSQKAINQIKTTQSAGSTSRSKKKREARDFDADYIGAQHVSTEGWVGIPAPAFRNAMIDACRLVGFKMTHAKLAVFVEAQGFDKDDGTPLVRIKGDPEKNLGWVRNETGVVDLRCRPLWREWSTTITLNYDGDVFSASDVVNLLSRAGLQVGIGEGRPNSKKSFGVGFGTFSVEEKGSAAA